MKKQRIPNDRIAFWLAFFFFGPMIFGTCDSSCRAPAQDFILGPLQKPRRTAPVVVPQPGKPRLLKSIEVKQGTGRQEFGGGGGAAGSAGIDKIDVYSNRRIRVTFYVHNEADGPIQISVNPKETILVDADGTEYRAVGTESNPRAAYSRTVRPGSRILFTIDYEEPTVTTTSLTATIIMNGSYEVSETMFPTFTVELPTNLGPDAEPEPAAPGPQPKIKGDPGIAPTTPGENPPPMPAKAAPKPPTVVYSGSATPSVGQGGAVGIEFASAPAEGMPLQARMFSASLPKLCGTLTGRVVDDPTTRQGLAYMLLDQSGNSYKLTPDGKILSGTSSAGVKLWLRLAEPAKRPASPARTVTRR